MLDFGTSDAHPNQFRFVDDDEMDVQSWYVPCIDIELTADTVNKTLTEMGLRC